jgi:hypothetical protein
VKAVDARFHMKPDTGSAPAPMPAGAAGQPAE